MSDFVRYIENGSHRLANTSDDQKPQAHLSRMGVDLRPDGDHQRPRADAQDKNISDSTQPYRPSAYSLITRHEGENSGLNTCKAASSKIVTKVVVIANHAAGPATCDGLCVGTAFVIVVVIPSSQRSSS